jgi:type IV pilus biogenesis protein CpaD/CtpE
MARCTEQKRLLSRGVLVAGALNLLLAGCVPGPPPPASQYHSAATVTRVPLVFVAGRAALTDAEGSELRGLRHALPMQALSALYLSGPLAASRATVVAGLLGRQVQLVSETGMPPDQGLLLITGPAIVADACRGKGERMLGSIWPGNDDAAPWLLPPGCATALDIEAQTTRPADLLVGRPLPPGAATPFAAAIERYYHRNDPPQSSASQGAAQGAAQGTALGTAQGGGDQSDSAAQGSVPNPLAGPLPSGQGGH